MMEEFRNEMRTKIWNTLIGARRNLEIKDVFEEAAEDLETVEAEIPPEEERLLRAMAQIGKSHRLDVFNFVGSLHIEEFID